MKHISRLLVVSFAIGFAACSDVTDLEQTKNELKSKKQDLASLQADIKNLETKIDSLENGSKSKFLKVNAHTISLQNFESFVKVHGVVTTDKNIVVVPEGAGIVRSILVRKGSYVKAGQVIAYLDSDVLDKNIKELQTSLEFATTLYEKQKALYDQNVGTEVQYLEAKNRKESLESSLATIQSQKAKSIIKAPIDGRIDEIFPNVGEMASQATPFARIVNNNNVYIEADISEAFINEIEIGDSVSITFPFSNEVVNAVVSYKSNYINPNNRTFKVNASFNSNNKSYAPNMLTVLQFRNIFQPNVIVVNNTTISTDWKGDFVYVLKKQEGDKYIAIKTSVTRGETYQNNSVITKGISAGDMLIQERYNSLNDGDIVELNKTEE